MSLVGQFGSLLRVRAGADNNGESCAFELLTSADLWSEPTSLSNEARGLVIRVLAAPAQDHTPPP